MLEDHVPVTIDKFMGFYDRGNTDTCPMDHFPEIMNCSFLQDTVIRRRFFAAYLTLANIKRINTFERSSLDFRDIILTYNSGTDETKLYDTTYSTSTPILTITGAAAKRATDFALLSLFDRAYISFHAGREGSTEPVYVYDGNLISPSIRAAAGAAPATGLSAADSATAGDVAAGNHSYAYAYETASGHITKPSAITTFSSVGSKKVDLSSIDNGPAGTVRKHILATRKYDPTLEPTPEFFFIDTIEDNVTTTKTINFYDFELIRSADYLFDLRETIPSGVFITFYSGRLITATRNIAYLSKNGYPESFDTVNGYNILPPGHFLVNGFSHRDNIYLLSSTKTYYSIDNGLEPIFWKFDTLDGSLGSTQKGVIASINKAEPTNDYVLIVNRSGLYIFNGYYNKPNLSWKIENYWYRIRWDLESKIQILNEPNKKLIYILVPIDQDTEPTKILVADYSIGLNSQDIRWSIWDTGFNISCIYLKLTQYLVGDSLNFELYLPDTSKLYVQRYDTNGDDFVSSSAATFKTAYILGNKSGFINHYGAVRFRIRGSGTIAINANELDGTGAVALTSISLASQPSKEITRLLNLKSERMQIQLSVGTAATQFYLSKIIAFIKPLWAARYNV